ncbi:hypothetical protein [Prevotella intermedia]|uniref:Uncharacterized protein n=1 Tax=Prevotella intermedia TaxID=28131 RepID=A0A2D3LNQ9_PREIN|nr:hypothetical protein [Prevotella intermedia]ATV32141.1 hypothetical protein CTM46_11730 [Prevotella intermedia]PJI21629.1 hypothetical protein CTM45_12710 [Prevotella intermedia]
MIKIKQTILSVSLILLLTGLSSWATSPKKIIYRAYISVDMQLWRAVIDSLHAKANKTLEQELELLNYEYGYIGWCLSQKKKQVVGTYLKRYNARLSRLTSDQVRSLRSAYRSAYYGFEIGLSKIKAPLLGPKSIREAEQSVELDPKGWLGYVQLGNIDFYKPSLFGGSKGNALKYYLKAEQILLREGVNQDWNLLSLWAQIGLTYEALNNPKNAELYYRKALNAEPQFKWVRDELYMNLKKKKLR